MASSAGRVSASEDLSLSDGEDLSAGLMAMSQGDPSGLAVVVAALARPGARLSERKGYTLAIAHFFGEGSGEVPEDRLVAARETEVARVLAEQLRAISAPLPPVEGEGESRPGSSKMTKRERFIYNATLSTMANLAYGNAYGGLSEELRLAGGLSFVSGGLFSSNEQTLSYSAAALQNMTNSDVECIALFNESASSMNALARVLETEGRSEETLANAAGAMINVSHAQGVGSFRRKSPTQLIGGSFAALIARVDDERESNPLLTRLRAARERKVEIVEDRAATVITRAARSYRARKELAETHRFLLSEPKALALIAMYAQRWRAWHLEFITAVRQFAPPFPELPTTWELAGCVADGVAVCETEEAMEMRRRLVRIVQGALHVLQSDDLADVCAWLRAADGCAVLVLLMLDDDPQTHESATHIVANLFSSSTDSSDGVRESRALLLRRRVLHALAVRLEPLAGPGAGALLRVDGQPEADTELVGSEQGAMYAAAALHNLSALDNLGDKLCDAIRSSVIESQLAALVLLNADGMAEAALNEAGDPARAAVVAMAAQLALGALCNCEEWSSLPTPSAADLALDQAAYEMLREAVRRQFSAQVAVRERAVNAARVVQRAARIFKAARQQLREERASAVLKAHLRGRGARLSAATELAAINELRSENAREAEAASRLQARARGNARRADEAREEQRKVVLVRKARRSGVENYARLALLPSAQQMRADFMLKREMSLVVASAARRRSAIRSLPAQRELAAKRDAARARRLAAAEQVQRHSRGLAARRLRDRHLFSLGPKTPTISEQGATPAGSEEQGAVELDDERTPADIEQEMADANDEEAPGSEQQSQRLGLPQAEAAAEAPMAEAPAEEEAQLREAEAAAAAVAAAAEEAEEAAAAEEVAQLREA
ncbi:hypothetical protein T492DRAFT_1148134, partial [Pavlovales sp. CCMP2436]